MTQLMLMRHGQTAWNANGRWQGHAPTPLNDVGRQQAQSAAIYLQNASITHIYSSDLLRAQETAQIVASTLNLNVFLEPRLRENDLGAWQGLTRQEIQAWDGENFRKVQNDPFNTPRPGGESWGQMAERACQAIQEIAQKHPNTSILAVTHGGTIRSIIEHLQLYTREIHIPNTSFTHLAFDNTSHTWSLVALGQVPHIHSEDFITTQGE